MNTLCVVHAAPASIDRRIGGDAETFSRRSTDGDTMRGEVRALVSHRQSHRVVM
jgi:hypothetical protein